MTIKKNVFGVAELGDKKSRVEIVRRISHGEKCPASYSNGARTNSIQIPHDTTYLSSGVVAGDRRFSNFFGSRKIVN